MAKCRSRCSPRRYRLRRAGAAGPDITARPAGQRAGAGHRLWADHGRSVDPTSSTRDAVGAPYRQHMVRSRAHLQILRRRGDVIARRALATGASRIVIRNATCLAAAAVGTPGSGSRSVSTSTTDDVGIYRDRNCAVQVHQRFVVTDSLTPAFDTATAICSRSSAPGTQVARGGIHHVSDHLHAPASSCHRGLDGMSSTNSRLSSPTQGVAAAPTLFDILLGPPQRSSSTGSSRIRHRRAGNRATIIPGTMGT